ncbi:MAG: HEAT repeat domain-containing protein [Acidobacteria bacterium]|nr:HEAT repeat domain-containing protein [Acidobacteriota bacterium]
MNLFEMSTAELIESARSEEDFDVRWSYVAQLHNRGNSEVFDAARRLIESFDPNAIELAADILGQLGGEEKPYCAESVQLLIKVLDSTLRVAQAEDEILAMSAALNALGRMNTAESREKVLEFVKHPSEIVRFNVTHGLLCIDDDEEIKALIELSADPDVDVRNWATFGLGSMTALDSSAIRDALFARISELGSETHDETRGEALVGLALRRDPRVLEPLIEELRSGEVGTLAIEAAAELGDPRICAPLRSIETWWDIDRELLHTALENCCSLSSECD